ncbi:hypothetical protein [Collinsella vaginalis]|uniref:hypothetical protein n=1 Tax=Collinsella vaginalis TaxID=1870987 RepID=UPI000A26B859|nr:hypothetical protein [Collinsella vaginalis]
MTGSYPDGVTDADIEREMDAGGAPEECGICKLYRCDRGWDAGVCFDAWCCKRDHDPLDRAVLASTGSGMKCWTGHFEPEEGAW